MFTLDLNWKTFNISLPKLREWIDANVSAPCVGISANSKLQVHFESEPSDAEKSAIFTYWEALDEESEEAQSYKSREQEQAEAQAAKQQKLESAKAKLTALGLTNDEIDVLLRI